MKLVIIKKQATGVFGGAKFIIKAMINISPEQEALIKKYSLMDEPIIVLQNNWVMAKLLDSNTTTITLKNLLNSFEFKCKTLGEIEYVESCFLEGYKNVQNYLHIASNFDTEVVFEAVDGIVKQIK